jgi:GT2 family glycosyltransferase
MTECAAQYLDTPLAAAPLQETLREVDVSIVTHRPDAALMTQLLASLGSAGGARMRRNLFIHDNTPPPGAAPELVEWAAAHGPFDQVAIHPSPSNAGFGRGHNANVARGRAPFLLLVNQDCILEPGVLARLLDVAARDADDVAAWELRQVPYEHPKIYDPVSLETVWVSGAAVLLRRAAFESVGGFDPRIFMYGEDVDLSWRLRARGWRLRYLPQLTALHHTYRVPHEVKPLQALGGVTASLCLRARYGGPGATLRGLCLLLGELAARQGFPGRRRGLLAAALAFLRQWPHFATTRVHPTPAFKPHFAGWSYEPRREGAFHPFSPGDESAARERPLVSILVRTVERPALLREALTTCAHQTYAPLEVVVVEDGPPRSRAVVDEFRDRLQIRYQATGARVGRARAGNIAMAQARGEWLNFLDDDDVLFADHVEVMVDAVQRSGLPGAYGLAWEFLDRPDAHRGETRPATRHYQRFDRFMLWHQNYMPIQSVLFNRALFERHGGFEEDMDQLEDWNLWTRYTLENDFQFVEKTTSKYRVPAQLAMAAGRQARLDRAYADALERQRTMRVCLSPREVSEMVEARARSEALGFGTRSSLRRFVGRHPLLARAVAYRAWARRVLRRLGWLR